MLVLGVFHLVGDVERVQSLILCLVPFTILGWSHVHLDPELTHEVGVVVEADPVGDG